MVDPAASPDDGPADAPTALERLIAHDEIRQLVSRYAVAVDTRDIDTLVSLFVPDVQVGRNRRGHEALREDFERSLRAVGVTVLSVGTQVVDLIDADRATGVVYCAGQVEDGDRWIHQSIVYRDTYARSDGRWRFVRRVHELFHGVAAPIHPRAQEPANWPEHADGVGTAPGSFPTWHTFWNAPPPR
ncbi:MAG: nuclear transport factor 2 family protein [Microthrixaceae bacterium]